jgi:hypothetical protein
MLGLPEHIRRQHSGGVNEWPRLMPGPFTCDASNRVLPELLQVVDGEPEDEEPDDEQLSDDDARLEGAEGPEAVRRRYRKLVPHATG